MITNAELFEFHEENLKLEPRLQEFLKKRMFPWELLGSALDEFLSELINSVPIDQRLQGIVHPLATLEGQDIVVEAGAVVEMGASVQGPCYICKGAIVRHGAYVRGQVYAGERSVIGHTTEVKGSLLLPDAKAAHFAYVGNSILGANTNLGAGTKLANLRFDHGPVKIRVTDGNEATVIHDTKLKKLGAILGNHAQTGCNSVTNPGTVLTAHSYLKPLELGSGVVDRKMPGKRK